MLPHHATLMCVVMNSAVCSGDSYKTDIADESEKQRHSRNELQGWNKRPANLFILALPCRCCHPWLSRMPVFLASHFTQTLFHTFVKIETLQMQQEIHLENFWILVQV